MQFYVIMDVFSSIFNDWSLLLVHYVNTLFKFDSDYSINYNNLTLINSNTNNAYQTDDVSMIGDKYDGLKTLQTKPLVIPIGAEYANICNNNFLNFDNDHASRLGGLLFPIERNKMVDLNTITAIREHLLTEKMTNRAIFTNPLSLTEQTGNDVKMREKVIMYEFEKCKYSIRKYLCNSTLVNAYSNGKTKGHFESVTNGAVPSLGSEARI